MTAIDDHTERFTLLRPLLFTIAYEILGSATDADDVLGELPLRWAEVDLSTVRDTKAYLAQLVTRQALNTLRTQMRRREEVRWPVAARAAPARRARRRLRRGACRVCFSRDVGRARDAEPG